jgi:type IX secretion system PorP/SprF family membrane protein
MRKIIFIILINCAFQVNVKAQDPHFSQYFSTPLLLNPALTGNIDGEYRVHLSYRNQWWQNGFPFTTAVVSGDLRALKSKIVDNSRLGFGISLVKDASLGGAIKNTKALISSSYHQVLDGNGFHSIGVGLQGLFSDKLLNINGLDFETQFNGTGFNLSTPSGENFDGVSQKYFDLNSGILYSYNNGENSYYIGGSLQNIIRPLNTFFSDSLSRVYTRKVIHGGGNFYTNSSASSRFIFSFLMMQQAKSVELNFGAAYGLNLNDNYLYVGLFSRMRDAIYPYISYQTSSIQLGLSYDITTSFLKNSRSRLNSLEFSIMYTRPDQTQDKKFMPWNF